MPSERPYPTSHLFTVRLWSEDLGDDLSEWRGQVTHVLSGEAHYFRGWQDLEAHLLAMVRQQEQATAAEAIQISVD